MSDFARTLWNYLLVSSPYLLLGLILAGLFQSFLNMEQIKSLLGNKKFSGVLKASLIGVPLPLCSCSVIPTAVILKKAGASNGATSAFLISTPESGIDSIIVTYGLMDLPMTIIRPVAAFASGFLAGVLNLIWNEEENEEKSDLKSGPEAQAMACPSCEPSQSPNQLPAQSSSKNFLQKIKDGLHFAYEDLIDDMALWLVLGILGGALIEFFIPPQFFEGLQGLQGKLVTMLVGIPLYICASAATPLAASLIAKGMTPGTALILLLAGPATNISNLAVLQKYIGKKGVLINIFSISFVALILSFITDWLYTTFAWDLNTHQSVMQHQHEVGSSSWWQVLSAILMILLLIKGLYQEHLQKYFKNLITQK